MGPTVHVLNVHKRKPSKHDALKQRWFNIAHRRRRYPNITKVQLEVKVIVLYKVWRFIRRLYNLLPGHWTCSFVCHFNSTESIQSCSHFGALNLSYTLPYVSSFSQLKHVTTSQRWEERNTIIFIWKPVPRGFEPTRQAATVLFCKPLRQVHPNLPNASYWLGIVFFMICMVQ